MYVAVKGGEKAIRAAHALQEQKRRGDGRLPELSVEQIGVVVKFFWTRRSDGRVMHRRATGRQGWPAFRTVRVIGSQVLNA
uniref:carbon-phosphorus lyase complex subunit PhnI n=1 Tax=Klebsiella pneumoniae TaxID=573 RepID=UPI003D7A338F